MMLFAILVLAPYVFAPVVDNTGACNAVDGWTTIIGGWCVANVASGMDYNQAQSECVGKDGSKILSATTEEKMDAVVTAFGAFTQEVWMRGNGFGWYPQKPDAADVFYHDVGYENFKDAATKDDAQLRADDAVERMFTMPGAGAPQWDFADGDTESYNVYCEVCIDDTQCGREALTKLGPHNIEDKDCASDEYKVKSYKMCDNCKCANHGSDNGAILITEKDNPRLECEQMAMTAGSSYYSFMKKGPGFRSIGPNNDQFMAVNRYCQFDQRNTAGDEIAAVADETDCTTNKDDTVANPWKIYKLVKSCKTCTTVIFDEPCQNCKCSSVHHIKFQKPDLQVKAASKQACAEMAYASGYTYASYRDDAEKFCYFGHEKSTEEECVAGKRREGTKAPWSILEIQCFD